MPEACECPRPVNARTAEQAALGALRRLNGAESRAIPAAAPVLLRTNYTPKDWSDWRALD
eukprot:scaffold4781_cov102-Isochrysis_galbana.AAC.4